MGQFARTDGDQMPGTHETAEFEGGYESWDCFTQDEVVGDFGFVAGDGLRCVGRCGGRSQSITGRSQCELPRDDSRRMELALSEASA